MARVPATRFSLMLSGEQRGSTNMNRVDGKVALISGAARGIGAQTARLMAQVGAKVVIGDVLAERGMLKTQGM
mgnify:CR=1 FL=1